MSSSYKLPWKLRLSLFFSSIARKTCCRQDLTVNRRLWSFFDPRIGPSGLTPRNGAKSSDITIDTSRNLWFRLYTPAAADTASSTSMPVIIFIHGGGFCLFEVDSTIMNMFCEDFARELGVIVASINYRLAPEHRHPCQYQDCIDSLKFIDSNFDRYFPPYADSTRCFLVGDSAGANLVHHTAVGAIRQQLMERLEMRGLISIQPAFGGEERTESEIRFAHNPVVDLEFTDWFWRAYLPDGSDRDHPAAHVFGPNSDDKISDIKFPPMLVVIGGLDTMQDWQRRYYEELKKVGEEVRLVEYPNANHGFLGCPTEYGLLIKEMKDFVHKGNS